MSNFSSNNQGGLNTFFSFPTILVAIIWLVKIAEQTYHFSLDMLGVYPRTLSGLIGIATAPLVHGSWQHLFSNTLPLLILGWMLVAIYPQSSKWVFAFVYFFTGVFVWLVGRQHYHIGASGIVYGFATFLLVSGILRKDRASMSITFFILIFYGGMIWGIFPLEERISWESHLGGAIAGIMMAYQCRNKDAKPALGDTLEDDTPETGINYRYKYTPKDTSTNKD